MKRERFNLVLRFLSDDRAATAIEYAMIAAGIALAVSATVLKIGSSVRDSYFNNVVSAF